MPGQVEPAEEDPQRPKKHQVDIVAHPRHVVELPKRVRARRVGPDEDETGIGQRRGRPALALDDDPDILREDELPLGIAVGDRVGDRPVDADDPLNRAVRPGRRRNAPVRVVASDGQAENRADAVDRVRIRADLDPGFDGDETIARDRLFPVGDLLQGRMRAGDDRVRLQRLADRRQGRTDRICRL